MQDWTSEIIQILNPYSEFAFILGSYGTSRFGEESDIDLAAYLNKNIDEKLKSELIMRLEDLTGRDIDLIDLRTVDPIFARQVMETGRLLLNNNPVSLVKWQAVQIGKYIDFKKDRLEIENKLLTRIRRD